MHLNCLEQCQLGPLNKQMFKMFGMRRRKRARGGGREKRGREGVASGRKREKRHAGMVELKEGIERFKFYRTE